jgi:hypothetical protein
MLVQKTANETTHHETTGEKIADAARGDDAPMDAKHPTVPFALVLGAYPIILVLALLAILAFIWFSRS